MQREGLTAEPAGAAEPVDDAALVAALVRGDRAAMATLYDRHASLLMALALRMLQDRAQAEELLHDVFLEAWHHARDYDPSRGTVRAWLLTRTRSRALDRRASRARQARMVEQAALEHEHEQPRPSDGGATFDAERVRRAMANLPEELIVVVELAYFEGLSSTEIGARLEIPTGTVKSRMARALASLREQIGPSPTTPTTTPGGAP